MRRQIVVGKIRQPLMPPGFVRVVLQVLVDIRLAATTEQIDVPSAAGILGEQRHLVPQHVAP